MKYSNMRTMKAILQAMLTVLLLGGVSTAMAGGDAYDLVFQGDASFQGAHGEQAIEVAVVHAGTGEVVTMDSGTVSKTADPAFSFTFSSALKGGEPYEVHYWIDSNFGGGSAGACDPKSNDHQWNVSLGSVEGDIVHTEAHVPAKTSDVCATFSD